MLVPGQEARASGGDDAERRKSGGAGGGLFRCVRGKEDVGCAILHSFTAFDMC